MSGTLEQAVRENRDAITKLVSFLQIPESFVSKTPS